jgi:protein-S-isoprenylcysteine O-methyltransferase Ste14
LTLIAIGIAIRQWAVVVLGRYFTTDVRVHGGQTVVETGPYRWVRHPSYTGMLITFVGIGLALGNWRRSQAAPAPYPARGDAGRVAHMR